MSKKAAKTDITFYTSELRTLLREQHPQGEWAFLEEVAPRTGGGTRYADAVAFNLWKSRGYAVHGFEIKVTRADWLRELKNPAKADEVFGYCDHWWVVAAPGIVNPNELPSNWGLLEPAPRRGRSAHTALKPLDKQEGSEGTRPNLTAYRLDTVVKAAKLEASPLSREFFASLMRRSHESFETLIAARTYDATQKKHAEMEFALAKAVADNTKEHESLKQRINEFEETTGLTINRWTGPPIEVIQLAQKLLKFQGYREQEELFASIARMADQMERHATELRKTISTINDKVNSPQPSAASVENIN